MEGCVESGIYVDEEANWFYEAREIIREDILEVFYNNLDMVSWGNFVIRWEGKIYAVKVADTPFVVARVDKRDDSFMISLKHLRESEILDLDTLSVGRSNILYCKVKRRFPARFSRPAYYQLARWIEEDPETGRFCITSGGVRHFIKTENE